MKKIILSICLCIFSLSVFAQTSVKYTSDNLNLRSLPSIYGSVLTVIPKGTSVNVAEDCDCDWIKVYYNGKTGYVSSKYLTKHTTTQSVTINPSSGVKYYTNSYGARVQSPTNYSTKPAGATALCRDGSYSFSQNRRGTCSHHGGVARWF